jgi:hypothetical protein
MADLIRRELALQSTAVLIPQVQAGKGSGRRSQPVQEAS